MEAALLKVRTISSALKKQGPGGSSVAKVKTTNPAAISSGCGL